ncbi:MAG TPA: AlpA family phage regulatory protein [Acidobacteriota bacterium]|nr:AlpA family phage regulatory protein [Acidobacteriota bacterium]
MSQSVIKQILSVKDVQAETGLGRMTIYRLEKNGQFPRRRQITPGRVGFLRREVEEWCESRPIADPASA